MVAQPNVVRVVRPCVTAATQGEATTAWIGVRLRCGAVPVTIAILERGRRAPVTGNPLTIRPRRPGPVVADWSNWCGARRGLTLLVRAGGETIRTVFAVLPLCLQPRRASLLVVSG